MRVKVRVRVGVKVWVRVKVRVRVRVRVSAEEVVHGGDVGERRDAEGHEGKVPPGDAGEI